ncbi:hypothetical protein GCM10009128_26190 [Psychrosphaera haliotis]|uniref:rhombosortase-dependent M36 family metallopeptidase n=1 Tax=Psychrosphaera haliotis TaxID=555083 RepID=UPI0031DFFFB7
MIDFKITGVSAAVALVLTSAGANAAPSDQLVNSVKNSKFAQAQGSFDAATQQALASKPTVSGLKSHYDDNLGKATFVWAPSSIKAPNLSGVATENRAAAASDHYLNALLGVSTSKGGLTQVVKLANMHDEGRGTRIAKYTQEVMGVEVFNREFNIMMDSEFNLVASSGYLAKNQLPVGQFAPSFDFGEAEPAILSAVKDATNGRVDVSLVASEEKGKYSHFRVKSTPNGVSVGAETRAKKVYFDGSKGLVPSYYLEVEVSAADSVNTELFSYVVDATNGKVLSKNSLTVDDSTFHYRAYAKDDLTPMQGPHGDVVPSLDPGNDTDVILEAPLVSVSTMPFLSTQDAWLEETATTTSGNNAFAYADVIAPGGFSPGDFTAETTSAQTFDYPLDPEARANTMGNRKAAIVNLFYMTNFLHDYYYDYGFDEASGNAQLSNYERGGVEGDPLLLEAQDNSGLNNANMSTPADGGSPRMQQFLWTDKDAVVGEDWGIEVTNSDTLGILSSSQLASFGPQQYSVTGSVVRIDDGTDTLTDGCEPAVNAAALEGNIAIIDRGECDFDIKVGNAQDAGAIGAIIVNNVDDGTPASMGGDDDTITIAPQGLSFADGASIYEIIDADGTVEVEMTSTFPLKDSTFDNAVIAHEFGHYIQNRLIGNGSGLNNFQGRAMGEGWADIHAMLFVTKESDLELEGNSEFGLGYGVGTYVTDFFTGIRRAPYTTDMDVNPYTFGHITTGAGPDGFPTTSNASPHGAGEIWAVALWEFYVAMINEHGFADAKDRMSRYVVEGYKLTPISPTYTEARDAILAAAIASDSKDFDMAIAAFAKRGMGLGAVSPARTSTDLSGVVESNATELAAFNAVSVDLMADYDGTTSGFCTADGVLDKGETGQISVTITNTGSEVLEGVTAQISVEGDADVTIANDGLVTFDSLSPFSKSTSSSLDVVINDASTADDISFVVTFPEAVEGDEVVEAEDITLPVTINYDFEKVDPVNLTTLEDMEDISTFVDWSVNIMDGGESASGLAELNNIYTAYWGGITGANLGGSTLFMADISEISDVGYETGEIEVGYAGDFTVSFWHVYLLETGYDGGVVELSLNGSEWQDVTYFGGQFMNAGYSEVLPAVTPDQPLAGRPVFSGDMRDSVDFPTNSQETINFGEALNGSTVKFRFRIATDSAASVFGWFVDNVQFTNVESPMFSEVVSGVVESCDNSVPRLVSISDDMTVEEGDAVALEAEGFDRDTADTLTYTWTQTSGPEVAMSGADAASMSFTAPTVAFDTDLKFAVTVSDGKSSIMGSSNVTVQDVPEPVAPEKKSSSGSFGWMSLLLLPLAMLRRRTKR